MTANWLQRLKAILPERALGDCPHCSTALTPPGILCLECGKVVDTEWFETIDDRLVAMALVAFVSVALLLIGS